MYAIFTKDNHAQWRLTDDMSDVAEADPENIIYDLDDLDALEVELEARHPAAMPGCSYLSRYQCGFWVNEIPHISETASDEAVFAAAREYGSIELHYNSTFYLNYRSHKLATMGDFILSGAKLTYDPDKALSARKKANTSSSKDIRNGDPKMGLIRGLSLSLRKLAFGHHVFKGFEMYRAVNTFGQSKAGVCRELLSFVRIIHSLHQGRDEWRKNKYAVDEINALIPYIPGLRNRAKFKDEKGEHVWWKRLAIFLEHEADARAAGFPEGNRVCEAVGAK